MVRHGAVVEVGAQRFASDPVRAAVVAQQIAPSASPRLAAVRRPRECDRTRARRDNDAFAPREAAPQCYLRVASDAHPSARKMRSKLRQECLAAAGHTQTACTHEHEARPIGRDRRNRPQSLLERAGASGREHITTGVSYGRTHPAAPDIESDEQARIHRYAASVPTVVVIGGGFAGLYAARGLGQRGVHVVLIDRVNYHLFQPLLYQVATAALSPGEIAEPLRAILRKYRSVEVLLGEVNRIDVEGRQVVLEDGDTIAYDYLVVATGARHSYFGHPEWEARAPGLKSLADALEMRRRIFVAFEMAEREQNPARRKALLTFVIVGGGPTGVELAGAIAEIARHTVSQDFRHFDPRQARVIVVERGERVLEAYPKDLSSKAQRVLEKLGVEVRTGQSVTDVEPDHVMLGDERIPAYTTLWAAGVASSALGRQLGIELDRGGRVPVHADLSMPGHPDIFVAGDLAAFRQPNGKSLPGLAPVAIQQGEAVAHNIWRSLNHEPRKAFHYFDRGNMATIGRAAAVAEIRGIHLSGMLAWLAWLFIHLLYLIGFENRLLVMVQWAASYISYERGARLITGPWQAGALPGSIGSKLGD